MLFADLVAFNGNLVTLGKTNRASACAVRDGKFVYVGGDRSALMLAGPDTERVDLAGKTVVPGFCDAHLHLAMFGANLLRQCDLNGVESLESLLDRLSTHAAGYEGPWILGRGFDQEKMVGHRWPTRTDLDKLSQTRPILLTRVCGHAVVANTAALALLTEDERSGGDSESGLYTETAAAPFFRLIPPLSDAEIEEGILRASQVALQTGITSVGTLLDLPIAGAQMGAFGRLHHKGELPIRVTAMPPYAHVETLFENGISTNFGDDFLRVGAAKFFSDGSFGARTALLAEPYSDEDRPENRGIRIYEPEDLRQKVADAQSKGFQVAIHAIGDQAVRESLDAIEYALGTDGDNIIHRHRVEHASLLPNDLMQRMAERNIVAVVQPQFVLSDVWTGARVGPSRVGSAYPFRAMLDAGIPLALSSDCPVEKLDAFACLAAVVGRHAWSPEGGLTGEEALRAYCLGGAYSLHADDRLGSLEAGKLADFVVLSGDPTRLSAAGLRDLKAEQIYVGGENVTLPATN